MNPILSSLTESEFQSMIVDRARALGWLVHHCRPARTPRGWATPIQGDPGFPDLVLARNGRVLFIEVKTAKGRTSDAQRRWVEEINPYWDWADEYAGEIPIHLVRPDDWADLQQLLEEKP